MIAYIHKNLTCKIIIIEQCPLEITEPLKNLPLFNVMVCVRIFVETCVVMDWLYMYLCLQLVFATTRRVCCVQASLGALWSSGCTAEATESKK